MSHFQFRAGLLGIITDEDIAKARAAATHTHAQRPPRQTTESARAGRALCDAIRIEKARDEIGLRRQIIAEDAEAMLQAGDGEALRRAIIGEQWRHRAAVAAAWAAIIAMTLAFWYGVGLLIVGAFEVLPYEVL